MAQIDPIAQRIKEILQNEGLSTYSMAKKAGVTHACVQKWVKGKAVPNGRNLIKIEEGLSIPPDWILYGLPPYKRSAPPQQ